MHISMKKNRKIFSLLFTMVSCFNLVYAQTANTYVKPYTSDYMYGSNLGYYGGNRSDLDVATLFNNVGGFSIRPSLPESFLRTWGYNNRVSTFRSYVEQLKMKELTVFVESPSEEIRDKSKYDGSAYESRVFKNLYEPIWNADGTVNANNYYADYIYKTVQAYGPYVKFWEVWNEPDLLTSQANTAAWATRAPQAYELGNLQAPVYYYIRMMRITYEIVKKYSPDAYIATGGIGYVNFLSALLRYSDNPDQGKITAQYPLAGGAYFDVLSFHYYPAYTIRTWSNSVNDFVHQRYSDRAANRVMEEKVKFENELISKGYNGVTYPKKLFIMTETGISRKTFEYRYGSDEMQRNFVMKTIVLSQKNDIKQTYFYTMGEQINFSDGASGTDEFKLMGFYENLRRDAPGAEKQTQAGTGHKTISNLLFGYKYDAAKTAQLALPASVNGAAFVRDSEVRYILWAKTATDKSEAASATYSFPDALNLSTLNRHEWDYSSTDKKTSVNYKNISLTGSPSIFTSGSASTNRAPVVNEDVNTTKEDTSVNGDVSTNDNDPDHNKSELKYTVVAAPAHGTLVLNTSGTYTYTPAENYFGSDSFRYRVTDPKNAYTEGNVTITIISVNDAPVANPDAYTFEYGNTLTVPAKGLLANDTDVENDVLKPVPVSYPANGTLKVNADGSFTYKHNGTATPSDSFTYRLNDGTANGNTTTVKLTAATAVNVAPIAADDTNTTKEDTSVSGDVSTNDSDPDNAKSELKYNIVTVPGYGTITFAANGTYTYKPNADYYGKDSFRYRVTDPKGLYAEAGVNITVTAVNDVPVGFPDTYTASRGKTLTVPAKGVLANDTDKENNTLKAIKVTNPAYGTLTLNADGSFTYKHDGSATSYDSFTYKVNDGTADGNTTKVGITIIASNAAPVAAADSYSLDQGKTLAVPVNGVLVNDSDADKDGITAIKVTNPSFGTLTFNSNGSFTYIHNGSQNTSDSFTYKVNDGTVDGNTTTVSLTIRMMSAPPVAVEDKISTAEDASITGDVSINDSDANDPKSSLRYTVVENPVHGTVAMNTNGTFTFTPAKDFNWNDAFRYRVTDPSGLYSEAKVTIWVSPVNDAPQAVNDANTTTQGIAVSGDVSTNDSDVDNAKADLRYFIVSYPSSGTVSLNINGTYVYTPAANFTGTDSFRYSVKDWGGLSTEASVTIKVNPGSSGTTTLLSTEAYQLYPNPSAISSTTKVRISTNETGAGSYTIYNLQGQKVSGGTFTKTSEIAEVELNMNASATGIYMVKIVLNLKETVLKMIKQ